MTKRKSPEPPPQPVTIALMSPRDAVQKIVAELENALTAAESTQGALHFSADQIYALKDCRRIIEKYKNVDEWLLKRGGFREERCENISDSENKFAYTHNANIAEFLWMVHVVSVNCLVVAEHWKLLNVVKGKQWGKASGDARLANRPWLAHAELCISEAYDADKSLSQLDLAAEAKACWKLVKPSAPSVESLKGLIRELREANRLGPRVPNRFG